MNKIKEVKELVNIINVAEFLGLKLNRSHFCKCPFHKEQTASLSISEKKQVWKCFGCGKGGDVINLVEELLHINAYQAAKYINDNLGLGLDFKGKNDEIKINRYKQKQIAKQQFKKWENRSFQILCDSIHKMNFVEKDQELSIIDYYLEAFIYGTDEEKIELYKDSSFRKKVDRLAKRYG
jgi:DNA primase